MALSYQSTRGGQAGVTASQAVLQGLAADGGLLCPLKFRSWMFLLKSWPE